ncbi:MAG: S1 RNA-binding domain-containing protein [Oscillospiraceae bacterium]|jgi:S1 RNA binding domain protein|nr:S1 RNA-binding domain-containing protein [Oscillospiraceae bacterium]
MELELGSVISGKVTGITKYGAFVTVSPGLNGLVHISEISESYVNEVSDLLAIGQEVTVKVIGLDRGKLNLSIKAALPAAEPDAHRAPRRHRDDAPREQWTPRAANGRPAQGTAAERPGEQLLLEPQPDADPSFEDRLQRFMKDADNKFSGLRQFSDKRNSRRRGK